MHSRPRTKTILSYCLVPLLSLAVLGCAKESTIADAGGPAEFPLPSDGSPLRLKDLKDVLDKHDRGDTHKHDRWGDTCEKKCVPVEIESVGQTNDIDPVKGPANARVVAEIRNKHADDTETGYKLKPSAKFDYYIWVDADKSGAARWTLVELEKIQGGMANVRHAAQGLLEYCEKDGRTEKSDADFKTCAHAKDVAAIRRSGLVSLPTVTSLWGMFRNQVRDTSSAPPDGPAWLRCVNGCCTTAQQQ